MLTSSTYPLNIARLRLALTDASGPPDGVPGPRKTRGVGYATYRLAHTNTALTLIYRLSDLYIDGFIPANGEPYLFKTSEYANAPRNRLAFDADYRSLGLSRTTAFRMNLDAVNGALISVYNVRTVQEANGFKECYWKLAVAFAEAVRFDDVLLNILQDKPIDDLDWSKHKRQDKVRVVKA